MIYRYLILATTLIANVSLALSQVTIGSSEKPVKGALLQLKNIDGITDGSANSTKGLLLPRVVITKLYSLDELKKGLDAKEHKGITVYNVANQTYCDLFPVWNGILNWNGKEWINLQKNNIPTSSIFIDNRDGESYFYSSFGDAGEWMVENLRATKYPITPTEDPSLAQDITFAIPTGATNYWSEYASYPNKSNNPSTTQPNNWIKKYGILYSYAAVTAGRYSDIDLEILNNANNINEQVVRGICPYGWHIPSDYEWNLLEKQLSENPSLYSNNITTSIWMEADNTILGNRPASSTTFDTSLAATMSSKCTWQDLVNGSFHAMFGGFDAPATGYLSPLGYQAYDTYASFWSSSTTTQKTNAMFRQMQKNIPGVLRKSEMKNSQLSVRCKKDVVCPNDKTSYDETTGILTDHEGNTYYTAKFGNAGIWMTENLNTRSVPLNLHIDCVDRELTFFNTTDLNNWPTPSTPGSEQNKRDYLVQNILIAYPNGNLTNSTPPSTWTKEYGMLYTHAAATIGYFTNSSQTFTNVANERKLQGLCPSGWHLPTDYEFNDLEEELSKNASQYVVAGGPTTAEWHDAYRGQVGYLPPNTIAGAGVGEVMRAPTSTIGTTPIVGTYPGYSKNAQDGGFADLCVGWLRFNVMHYGVFGVFHGSSPQGLGASVHRRTDVNQKGVYSSPATKGDMMSIRCKKD